MHTVTSQQLAEPPTLGGKGKGGVEWGHADRKEGVFPLATRQKRRPPPYNGAQFFAPHHRVAVRTIKR
jgi:hypothetical protein